MDGTIEERLSALERAVTDGDHDCSSLSEAASVGDRVERLESQLTELDDRVAELEAATQALRGYVGSVRSVNTDVEKRADAALAKAETAHRLATTGSTDADRRRDPNPDRDVDGPRDQGLERDADRSVSSPPTTGTGTDSAPGGTSDPARDPVDRTDRSVASPRCERCAAPLDGSEGHGSGPAETGGSPTRIEELGGRAGDPRDRIADRPAAETDGGTTDAGDPGMFARLRDLV
jgi:hypothetical protein